MLRVLFVLPIVMTAAAVASAQDPERSRWGVSGSFAPEWSVPSEFKVLFDADTVSITGSEFRIGFVRGRMLGGDWGVSFVRKRVDDGSYEESLGDTCFGASCFIVGTRRTVEAIHLKGVRVHRFIPFVTIRRRVEIGRVQIGDDVRAAEENVRFVVGSRRLQGETDA